MLDSFLLNPVDYIICLNTYRVDQTFHPIFKPISPQFSLTYKGITQKTWFNKKILTQESFKVFHFNLV